jgi:glycosyltransferase involved in cell wall biosynthesis
VANDGSDDNTVDLVKELAAKSDFPVTLINASERVGKSRMDNELVKAACGEFIIWCDSDDTLYPHALTTFIEAWEAIPHESRDAYMGLTALCDTKDGVLVQEMPTDGSHDVLFNAVILKLKNDIVIFSRTLLLKATPFLEVDFLIPETSVWYAFGKLKTRWLGQVLQRKQYGEAHALSFTGRMAYNRGRAHAIGLSNRYVGDTIGHWQSVKRSINFVRYCVHGDIAPAAAWRIWKGHPLSYLTIIMVAPVALLLAARDRYRGVVQKTHLDFERAKQRVTISVERLARDQ